MATEKQNCREQYKKRNFHNMLLKVKKKTSHIILFEAVVTKVAAVKNYFDMMEMCYI